MCPRHEADGPRLQPVRRHPAPARTVQTCQVRGTHAGALSALRVWTLLLSSDFPDWTALLDDPVPGLSEWEVHGEGKYRTIFNEMQ